MSYAKRMSQLPTSRMQHIAALALTAILAFSLGLATGPLSRHIARLTGSVAQPRPAAVVAPATNNLPAAAMGRAPALVRVPYEAGWELYDGGWAGGPAASQAGTRNAPALVRVPYEAGWDLYDNGWAGGPAAPQAGTSNRSVLSRVPYEAGWELYDGGWAGGPNTLPQRTSGQ